MSLPREELVAEGRATGASELFLTRTRGRLASKLERQPRIAIEEIVLATHGLLAGEVFTCGSITRKGGR